ncbi:MAG: elongation factor G [SAR202 cluster bacterium]|nr:elongation factor G [SAR202 cluster bacterium]
MAVIDSKRLRNVVLLSHSGAGKTMVSEAMLFASKAISRAGKTDDGSTTSDYDPEETKRLTSVQTSVLPCTWKDHKLNVLDTPGYADYRGEVVSGLRVADAAVIVVSAAAGVEVGTEQVWKLAAERGLPRIIFVNKMDRENTSFQQVMASIQDRFGRSCVAVQFPEGTQASFKGAVDLLGQTYPDEAEAAREQLTEAIAETDDALVGKYLEGQALTQEELHKGLKKGTANGTITPVVFGSALHGVGAEALMDLIVELFPSPADVPAAERADGGTKLECKSSGPLAALVFKTSADPFVGKLSYFRVYSGTLTSDSHLWNASRNEAERIGQAFFIRGKSQESVPAVIAGDIGAVAKLQTVQTGDTLAMKDTPVVLPGLTFPQPVFEMAVAPKTKADLDKMTSALARIAEEDPSLRVDRNPDTLEIVMHGLGDTHLAVAVEKMKRKFGVDLDLRTPRVPYKETVRGSARVEYKHKKQTGGHGQYGHVWLEIEPLERGAGFEFVQKVVGGSVPKEYIPSVEKGVTKALGDGVVAGYPVVDVRATLVDGSFHPVDSSGVSFEIAASHAFSKGIRDASPTLLEPILLASIVAPDSSTGDIMGGLNGKRGRILGMTQEGEGYTRIEAEVPHAEMLRYATELRSLTGGRGSFTAKFHHMEPVPEHLMTKIVEERQQQAAAAAG